MVLSSGGCAGYYVWKMRTRLKQQTDIPMAAPAEGTSVSKSTVYAPIEVYKE